MPNTGTITGLTPATDHVLDAVHVDAWGNVSGVVSSATFITGVASGPLTGFVESHALPNGQSSITIPGATLGAGFIQVGLANGHAQTDLTILGVTIDGVAATPLVELNAGGRRSGGFYQAACSAASGDIVIALSGALDQGGLLTIYHSSGQLAVVDSVTGIEPSVNFTAAELYAADMNVTQGGSVLAIAAASGFGANGAWSTAGLGIDVANFDYGTYDMAAAWSAHELPAAAPMSIATTGDPSPGTWTRCVLAAVSLEAA